MKCCLPLATINMKKTNLILALSVTIGMGFVFTACSDTHSNEGEPAVSQQDFNLTQSSDFAFSSRTSLIGSTFDTRAANTSGNIWYKEYSRPTNVTDAERAKVVEEFSQKREGAKNQLSVTWKFFYVQQVYKGETEYKDGYNQNIGKGSDHMDKILVFNNLKTEVIKWDPKIVQTTEYEGTYEHIYNFNNGNNNTIMEDEQTHDQYIGTTLMEYMGTDGRDEQFSYHNTTDDKYHYEYIILKIDGNYYVGFDFYAHGTDIYPNNHNQDVERDWVFNDWIVKITPAQKIGEDPVKPDLEEEPVGPVNPVIDPNSFKAEIEVNLSMNAERDVDDYIYTKLSIHIRDTSDVEVFIPVTPEYYCEADDMDIVLSHKLNVEMHSPQPDRIEYDINGHTVTATVSYEATGIRIKTQGITPEVLKYLRETYSDGLTIEVWNYYNDYAVEQGRNELKKMLDKSTVKFTTDPQQYVNAFAKVDDVKNPLDCVVTPPSGWNAAANDGTWDYNVIYVK